MEAKVKIWVVGATTSCEYCGQQVRLTTSAVQTNLPKLEIKSVWLHWNRLLSNFGKVECVWIATPQEEESHDQQT